MALVVSPLRPPPGAASASPEAQLGFWPRFVLCRRIRVSLCRILERPGWRHPPVHSW